MQINHERSDLNAEQINRIGHIFKYYPELKNDPDELIRRLINASDEEYSTQLLNDGRISTIGELYQFRLFL